MSRELLKEVYDFFGHYMCVNEMSQEDLRDDGVELLGRVIAESNAAVPAVQPVMAGTVQQEPILLTAILKLRAMVVDSSGKAAAQPLSWNRFADKIDAITEDALQEWSNLSAAPVAPVTEQGWNDAIEAAAKILDQKYNRAFGKSWADEIRELKRSTPPEATEQNP